MAATSDEMASKMESGDAASKLAANVNQRGFLFSPAVVTILQKVLAELIGTYFIIFAGCGSVVANKVYDGLVTFPGICITWGLIVSVMIYTVAHVSGAHFNPAVTITFALLGKFPWKEVPLYAIAQLVGSILASVSLDLLFDVTKEIYYGTIPAGSDVQSLAAEIIISFLLMFVICGICTDDRAVGQLGGLAVGMTITLNVFVTGPISGASMNPTRSLGPAIVRHQYKGIWVYIVGPIVGVLSGAFCYNLIRFTNKPIAELTKLDSSFFKTKSTDDDSTN